MISLKTADSKSWVDEGSNLGIPIAITLIRPRKIGDKKNNNSCDAFVEFIHPNSTNRMLKIASTCGFCVSGKKLRVYKAGTRPERMVNRMRRKNI